METPALKFLYGRTTHTRFVPFRRTFGYAVNMIEIDLGRLEDAERSVWGFSAGSFDLMRLNLEKYGNRHGDNLLSWALEMFQQHGVSIAQRKITLATFPDVLGLGFSPISLWLLKDTDDAIHALIYEVHNTFGDRHSYVVPFPPTETRHEVEKELHVSPFFDVTGKYRFTVSQNDNRLRLLIENLESNERTHTAVLDVTSQPATTPRLLRRTLWAPLSGLSVIISIHWQALWIWLKGAKYHSRPEKSGEAYSMASSAIMPRERFGRTSK